MVVFLTEVAGVELRYTSDRPGRGWSWHQFRAHGTLMTKSGSKLPLGSFALGRLGCRVRQREVWLLVDIQDD